MDKKIHQGDFIDKSIDDVEMRCLCWISDVNASAGAWDNVLKAKWMIARYLQKGS